MAIQAKLFDGTVLQFPDDTDHSVIDRVAAQETAARQKPVTPTETPAATATPTATPVAAKEPPKTPAEEPKASTPAMPFAVTKKEMAEKFGTSDQRSPVERLIAQQEGKAPTPSPYKTEGAFERAGLTTDAHEALIRSIANEDQFTNPVARKAARKVAETNVAIASDKAKQALRSGASEDEANQIFKEHIGSVAGASVAPESYEYQKEYAFKPNATVAGDLGNLARRAGAKGITGLEQGAGGIYKFVADMADANAPGIDAQLETLRSKQEGLSASELHGSLVKDTASLFENAGSSIIQQLPALGGGLALKSGQEAFVLSNMFVNSFGQTYDDSRRQGLDISDAAIRSSLYGAFEVAGEKVGLGSQMKALKGIADHLPTSKVKEFFIDSLKKEIPGELGTYTGQFATDKGFGLNQNAGLNDFFDGAVQTVLATLAQGGMMAGAGTAASYVGNKFNDTTRADNRANLAREDALAKWNESPLVKPATPAGQPTPNQPTVPGQPAANQEPTQTHAEAVQQLALTTRISELENMGVPPDDAKDIATKEQNEKLGGSLETDSRYTDNRPAAFSIPVPNVPGGNATGPSAITTPGLEGTTLPPQDVGAGKGTESGALDVKSDPLYPVIKSIVEAHPNVTPELVAASFKISVPQATHLIESIKLETTEEAAPQTKAALQNVLGLQTPETTQTQTQEQVTPTETTAKEEVVPEQDEHLQQAKQVAGQLRKLDPTSPLLERLRSPDVLPSEIEEAQSHVAALSTMPEEGVENPATADDVTQALQGMYTPAQLRANPPVVVNSIDELPEHLREEAKESKAFVDPATGQDYYVADQISKDNIRGAILHERGGHVGLTNLIGAFRVKVLANQINKWANTPNDTLEHKIATEAMEAANASGEKAGSNRHNQEVIAYFTEIATTKYGIDPLKSQPKEKRKVAEWLRSLWKNIASAIKKLNIDPSTLTSEDVVNLVVGASRVGTNRLEKAEARSVFTPEVLQEIQFAMGSSIVVANEIGAENDFESDDNTKLLKSAKDLILKVVNAPAMSTMVTRTFINTFYDTIKTMGTDLTALNDFIVTAYATNYFTPPEAKITKERLLRTLTPVSNLQEALTLPYQVRQIWNDPEKAAQKESDLVSKKRREMATKAYDTLAEIYFSHNDMGPNGKVYEQIAVLLKYAISKYSMAGNKIITMSADNEYLPISFNGDMTDDKDADIVRNFASSFGRNILAGDSIKQAFADAHNKAVSGPRNNEIEKELGPSQTGWIRYSRPVDASALKLVTTDVGTTAKSPWCVSREISYGESYLRRYDFFLYLKDGQSLVSALVDKDTLQPTTKEKAWFGLAESQNILPQHEYIKNTLPTLATPINAATSIANATPNQDGSYLQAERIFKKAATGDRGALKSLLTYSLYKTDEQRQALELANTPSVYSALFETFHALNPYSYNNAVASVLGIPEDVIKEMVSAEGNLESVERGGFATYYTIAVFPEIKKLADANGNVTINPTDVMLYKLNESLPKDIFKTVEDLLAKYGVEGNLYEYMLPYYQTGEINPGQYHNSEEVNDYFKELSTQLYRIIQDKRNNSTATEEEVDKSGHSMMREAMRPVADWLSEHNKFDSNANNNVHATININSPAYNYVPTVINGKFTLTEHLIRITHHLYEDHNLGESPVSRDSSVDDYVNANKDIVLPRMVNAAVDNVANYIENKNKNKILSSKAKLPNNRKNLWASAKAEIYHELKNGVTDMALIIAHAKQALGTKARQLTKNHYELAYKAAVAQLKKETALAKRRAPKPYVDPNAVKIGLAQNFDYIPEDLAEVADNLAIRPAEVKSNPLWNLTKAVARATGKRVKTLTASGVSTGYIIEKLINAYKIPYIDQLNTVANNMNVMYSTMMSAVSKLQDEWEGFADKDKEANHLLSVVQLYSTLEDIDPTTFTTLQDALKDDPELIRLRSEQTNAVTMQKKHALTKPIQRRTDAVKKFFAAWTKLSNIGNGQGVQLFVKVRNFYKTMNMLHRKLLTDLINKSDLEGDIHDATTPKGKLMAAINAQFVEKGINNYFPLGRYGDFWLTFGKGANKESYRFESLTARELFRMERVEQLQAAGDARTWEQRKIDGEADIGEDLPALRKNLSSDETDILRKVLGIIDSQSKDTLTKESLKDAVYQLFLETAPEQSFRKHWMHRKEITGFTTDMKRHFINTGVSLASQLSRLKYGAHINELMENAEEYLKGNPAKEEVSPYMNELKWRIHQLVNPQPVNTYVGPVVNGITQGVFMWTLSSPVTALVDLTALPIFGYSTLSRHFGVVDATAAMVKQLNLIKYFTLAAKNSNGKYIPISLGLAPHVKSSPILTAAYNEFVRTELLEKTSSHELLGMAKLPSAPKWKVPYVPSARNTMYVTANILGFFFHQTGRLNREMMALTAFELAYNKAVKEGMAPGTYGEAYNHAMHTAFTLTNKAMFDYTAFNRPGILRPLPMRVLMQLKSFLIFSVEYAIEGTSTVLRTTNNTPEQRAGAIKQILISAFMMLMFAGASGLIGIDDLWGVIQLIYESMHPEGKKQKFNRRDIKLWFEYSVLPNAVGADMAELILKGPVSHYTGIDFSSRISLGRVLFPQRQAYDGWLDSIKHLNTSFPASSTLSNFIRAGQEFNQGHIYQAWEHLTPNLVKNPIQADQWAKEGVRNEYDRGLIYKKEMLTKWDLMWKALGANPLPVAAQREKNFVLDSARNKITDRRRALLDKFAVEVQNHNPAEVKKVFKDIAKFNRDNPQPEFIIDADVIETSINSKLLKSAKEYHGLKIPDSLRGQAAKLYNAGKEEAE